MSVFADRTRVYSDDLPSVYVHVSGDNSRGLVQYAGRVARKWARDHGYIIVERIYVNVSATYSFATGVESRYRVSKINGEGDE